MVRWEELHLHRIAGPGQVKPSRMVWHCSVLSAGDWHSELGPHETSHGLGVSSIQNLLLGALGTHSNQT